MRVNHINYSRNFCRLSFKFLLLTSFLDTLIGVHNSIFFTASKFKICNLSVQSHVKPQKKFMLLSELLREMFIDLQSLFRICSPYIEIYKKVENFLFMVLKIYNILSRNLAEGTVVNILQKHSVRTYMTCYLPWIQLPQKYWFIETWRNFCG